MASNINPQNINGAYPVAGQDNDSQGFRDNFTNIRNNFQFAAAEITDLENKAVLKAALDGTVLNNDMGGSILSNAQLQDMSAVAVPLGTVSGTITLNYAAGSYYSVITAGSLSVDFSNFPPAGQLGTIQLAVTVTNIAFTLTLPGTVGAGDSSTSTLFIQGFNSNVITFDSPGTYVFEFRTNNGGSAVFIEDLVRTTTTASITNGSANVRAFLNSNVAVSAAGAANVAVFSSGGVNIAGFVNATGNVTGNVFLGNGSQLTGIGIEPTVFTVTIADDGSGTQDVFFFNGTALQTNTGVQFPITLQENNRYRFDLSAAINADAPLRFSTTPDSIVTIGNVAPSTITDYATGVTISGNAGTAGSFVEIEITDQTPNFLFFWGIQQDPGLDTSLLGAARPISIEQQQYFSGPDQFSANGNISLETTTTIITSSANLTGNLAAGSSGQFKILAYGNISTGNTLVAVANAAWGSTANLSTVGSAATFLYVGNKWFCTGNNGVTFS